MFITLPHRSAQIGQRVVVEVVDDLPVADFARGLPSMAVPTTHLRGDWERWLNELISRALVRPLLTPKQVDSLGGDRGAIAKALVHAWGLPWRQETPTLRQLYEVDFLQKVRRMALATRRLPTEILAMPTRDFWTNFLILFGSAMEPTPSDRPELLFGDRDAE